MKHTRVERCGSTNDEARRLFQSGDKPPYLVSTVHQTAGRGREARSWQHDPKNFAGSFVFDPQEDLLKRPGCIALMTGLAVRQALTESGADPLSLSLKWPNDVLYCERKVGGVLAETIEHQGCSAVVIGVGVNLIEPPSEARFPAASVFTSHDAPDPKIFGDRLAKHMMHQMGQLTDQGFPSVLNAWRACAWRLGERITVGHGQAALSGRFVDVADDGRLILELNNGEQRLLAAGDVSQR